MIGHKKREDFIGFSMLDQASPNAINPIEKIRIMPSLLAYAYDEAKASMQLHEDKQKSVESFSLCGFGTIFGDFGPTAKES